MNPVDRKFVAHGLIYSSASLAALLMCATALAAETQFPPKSRILGAPAPADCVQWTPPRPTTTTNVAFPRDIDAQRGEVALLLRIGADGGLLWASPIRFQAMRRSRVRLKALYATGNFHRRFAMASR